MKLHTRIKKVAELMHCANLFVLNPDLTDVDLSEQSNVHVRTIRRWITEKRDHWDAACLIWGHPPEDTRRFPLKPPPKPHNGRTRSLHTDVPAPMKLKAYQCYAKHRRQGLTHKRACTSTGNDLGMHRDRMLRWAKAFEWQERYQREAARNATHV